jgi:hypothetical protein
MTVAGYGAVFVEVLAVAVAVVVVVVTLALAPGSIAFSIAGRLARPAAGSRPSSRGN